MLHWGADFRLPSEIAEWADMPTRKASLHLQFYFYTYRLTIAAVSVINEISVFPSDKG